MLCPFCWFYRKMLYESSLTWSLPVNQINVCLDCGLVAQAVSRSPPTAGVPSSRLGPSMWVLWWMKRGLGRFFSGFLPFSPTTNFIPPFLHTYLIHFVSFHPPLWWCIRRGRPAPLHLIPRPDLVLDTSWGYLFIFYLFIMAGLCMIFSYNTICSKDPSKRKMMTLLSQFG